MATKLPKNGRKLVKDAGAARRRTLGVMYLALCGGMTKAQIARKMKLTERTIERILDDAVKVGFELYTSKKRKAVLLAHGKGKSR